MEKITLLHTNDLHSHFENWPKIRRFLEQRKAALESQGHTVITVDLGDFGPMASANRSHQRSREHCLNESSRLRCYHDW